MSSSAGQMMVPPVATHEAPLWQEVVAPRYKGGSAAWLLTFVDLTGLMVVFFVMMFSRQTLQADKWDVISGSFKAKFAPVEAVVPSLADGANNAEEVTVAGATSGLGYLDILLRQRLEKQPVWAGLGGRDAVGTHGSERVYNIPDTVQDPVANKADWQVLAQALRGWKNPVGVRVRAAPDGVAAGALKAQQLAAVLQDYGVPDAFAEVGRGAPVVELVVRAK